MNRHAMLTGALIFLGLALMLNAAALFFSPSESARTGITGATPAHALSDEPQPFFYLARDTYLITTNGDGTKVYLWYYDHNPRREDNDLEFVTSETAQ